MPSPTALSGLRVIDLTNLLAAPQIAASLADFGADVIKIEPLAGDPLRRMGVQRGGAAAGWALVARNKRTLSIDLDREEGRGVLRRLVEEADVLIENLPGALLERWQCDYATLSSWNPRLIVTSVSCYGRTGPYRDRAGAGALAEAFAGFAHMNGEAEGPPMLPSIPLGDMLSGFSGVIGVLLACYARDRGDAGSGRGQHVDVSMAEPILQLLALPFATYAGEGAGPKRTGSRVEGGAPRNLYRCRDAHWIALSATTDSQAGRVLELLGCNSDEDRARFGHSAGRIAEADELDARVAEWIAARDRETVLEAFHEARLPVAPVNDLGALLEDPHVRERASLVTIEDPRMGPVSLVAPTPRLSETPGRHSHTGRDLGADTEAILGDWLDLPQERVAALRDEKVVG